MPVIRPEQIRLQSEGLEWSEYLAIMPQEGIVDYLRHPGIWRDVQNATRSLRVSEA